MQIIRKNIVIFGAIPPPVTGAAISNELVGEILIEEYNVFIINTSVGFNKPKNNPYNFTIYIILTIYKYSESLLKLAFLLRKNKIHAFYFLPSCNTLGHLKDSVILLLFGHRLGKIVGHLHNSNFKDLFQTKTYRFLTNKIFNRISLFIFSSQNLSNECDKYMKADQKTYFNNTINQEIYCSEIELNQKYNLKYELTTFSILFVGHMLFSKGCFDLLKSILLLHESGYQNLSVIFVGGWIDAREEKEFNAFLIDNKMSSYVKCDGIIKDLSVLKQKYLSSDIFALPTYYPYESQPLSIIDAMNAGNPIISTDHGTIADFVISGQNGILVEKHNPEKISEAIIQLLDRNKWLEFAKQARLDFNENFSYSIYRRNLLKVFKSKSNASK